MTDRNRKFPVLTLSVLTALSCATLAHANLISYTTNVGGGGSCTVTSGNGSTNIGADCTQLQVTDYSWSIALPKFDSSLGTLNSVSIYFYENTDVVNLQATNNLGGTATVYLVAAVKPWANFVTNSAVAADRFGADYMTLYDSTSGSHEGSNPANYGSCADGQSPQGGCTGGTTLSNGQSTGNLGGYSISNIDDLYTTDLGWSLTAGTGAAAISPITGIVLSDSSHNSSYTTSIGSTFTLSGATTTLFTGGYTGVGGAGTIAYSDNIQTQFSAEVDYTYTPITSTPEPATLGLMGSALIGLGVLSKKLRRKI